MAFDKILTGILLYCMLWRVYGASILKSCPHHTIPLIGGNGNHAHCICPNNYICENCSRGCHEILKGRCVNGFKPQCESCFCKSAPSQPNPTPENFIKISTRIKDSWCEFPPEILEKYKYKGNATFVFIVSNGHTGTTFLGQQMNWRLAFGRVPKGFIVVHENEPDKAFLKHLAFSNEYCNEALEYVYNQKLPFMLRALDKQNAHTYFAAGHQIILGILPALADILGHRAKFVRLRRSRLDTAYSFFQKRVGPCHKLCIYCICPLDPIARCPITSSVLWNQLNTFQQYLWAVDEVECQWQSLMNARPEIEYMELNWKDSLPTSAMQQLANFIGMPELTPKTAEVAGTNRHVKPDKKGQKNMTLLNHWAADYDKLLGFRQCNAFTCILNVKDN